MAVTKQEKVEFIKKLLAGEDPRPPETFIVFDKDKLKGLSLRPIDTCLLFILSSDDKPLEASEAPSDTLYHPEAEPANTDTPLQEERALQDIATDNNEVILPPQEIKEAIQADPQEKEAIPVKPAVRTFNLMGEIVETMEKDKQRRDKMIKFSRGYNELNHRIY